MCRIPIYFWLSGVFVWISKVTTPIDFLSFEHGVSWIWPDAPGEKTIDALT